MKNKYQQIMKKLNEMEKNIKTNSLWFRHFEEYYMYFKGLLNSELSDEIDWFPVALTLIDAEVIIVSDRDESDLFGYKEDLSNIIASKVRENITKKGINLTEEFNKINEFSKHCSVINFESFCKSFDNLQLAIKAKLDDAFCIEWANVLLKYQVNTNSLDERRIVNSYEQKLTNYIKKLEPQKTDSVKK